MTWFEKNRLKTYMIVMISFFVCFEIILQAFFKNLTDIDPSQRAMRYSNKTFKEYIPGTQFTRETRGHDSFSPASNIVNSAGIRGPEINSKTCFRVINLGDSFIQADEVQYSDTFGARLNVFFNEKIEFISHGLSSWSPTTEFSWLYHAGMIFEPDEVNLFLCINDFFRNSLNTETSDKFYRDRAVYSGEIPTGYEISIKRNWMIDILKKIQFVRILYFGVQRLYSRTIGLDSGKRVIEELIILSKDPKAWPAELKENTDDTIRVIKNMNDFLALRKVKLNVLFVPLGYAWSDELKWQRNSYPEIFSNGFTITQDGIEEYVKNNLKANKIPYIGLNEKFSALKSKEPSKLLFNEEDGHWNAHGHQVVYDVLKQYYARMIPSVKR